MSRNQKSRSPVATATVSARQAAVAAPSIEAEIARRGITPEMCGMSLDTLADTAATQEDWRSYLDLFVPADTSGPAETWTEDPKANPRRDVEQAVAAAISDAGSASPAGDTSLQESPSETASGAPADTWTEEKSGPPVFGMQREETVVVSGPQPWRDPQTFERLPGYNFRLVETPSIDVPPHLNLPRHLDVNGLTLDQAIAWRQTFLGLEKAGVKLANGRKVATSQDAIRWLLEQLR